MIPQCVHYPREHFDLFTLKAFTAMLYLINHFLTVTLHPLLGRCLGKRLVY